MSQYVTIRKQGQKKVQGKQKKKKFINRQAYFYAKANKLKYEIRENDAVIIDLKRHNAQ